MPMATVSLSARFADHDDVRGQRAKGAHDEGKVDAGLAVDLDLARTFWVISTGSSSPSRFWCPGVLGNFRMECSVVVLPEPVGPQT